MSQSREARVAAAVKGIRDFHALGLSVPPKRPAKDAYNRGEVDKLAGTHAINPDTLRKARRFADPAGGYTAAEVEELCRLVSAPQPARAGQAAQEDERAVFGRTHLIRMLGVDKARRPGLQEEAVRCGWSCAELEAQIAARYGSRRGGGRRPRRPADVLGLLARAERLCEGWRRWVAAVTPNPGQQEAEAGPATLGGLPDEVRELVFKADAAMAALQKAAAGELAKRLPGRTERVQSRKSADAGEAGSG